jgi:NADH:ubiquinone oxidoreductase subunit 6 (subunit J)
VSAIVTFWLLTAVALVGAAAVVLSRDALRLVLGLGAFLMALAGFYVYYGMGFLAAAQVFVYVGGVLVLVLFALLLLARDEGGRLLAPARFDISALSVGLGIAVVLGWTLRDVAPPPAQSPPLGLGATLLGPMLPAFELGGVLLLAALVAVLVIVAGGERE